MKTETKKFLLTCVLALATLFIPIVFGHNQLLSIGLLLITSLLMLSMNWSYGYLIFFILVLISGPAAEATAIHFGTWRYEDPFFFGVPIWLPLVWGNAGLYIVRLWSFIDSHRK